MSCRRPLARPVALIGLALAAACSPDSATRADPALGTDLGQWIASMDLPYFSMGTFATPSALQSKLLPSNCAYYAATMRFLCPTSVFKNLHITRSFALSGASGPQSRFDSATTDAIETSAHLTNADTAWGWVWVTDATETLRLTGLRTGTRVLTGGSVEHMTSIGGGGAKPDTVVFTSTRMLRNLTFSGFNPFPTSGTIDIEILTEGGGFASGSVHQQVVFDGSSRAQWIVTSDGPKRTCTVDLTGQSEAVCTQ